MPSSTTGPFKVLALSAVLSLVLLGVLAVVGHGADDGEAAGEQQSAVAPEVLDRLRAGGVVLLMRHAITDRSVSDADPTARGTCEQQRNLSEAGVEQARVVGERLRVLDIPIGTAYASPFCRTVETAEAMVGSVVATDALLSLTAALDATGAAAITAEAEGLVEVSLAAPEVTIMVTHTQNIEALTGLTVEEGDAVVLTEAGPIGVVPAADW